MSMRIRMLKGGASLGLGQVAGQGLALLRNALVARLVTRADYGIANALFVTVLMLELLSDLAADRLLIQAQDGDEPRFQATAHLWQFVRGVVSATLIFAFSWPLAWLFDVPDAQWAFCCIALVPLIRGFLHLDIRRVQRHMRFGPAVTTETTAQVVALLAAVPLAWWLRDYSAMLWAELCKVAVLLVLTHALAERPYQWAWERRYVQRLLSFGWPLLINGALLFAITQGDRVLVGAAYTMEELGLYAAVATLLLTPAIILGNASSALLLPPMAQVQHNPPAFLKRYALNVQAMAAVSGVLTIGLVIFGALLVRLVFGEQYRDCIALAAATAGMQALRLLRIPPTVAAIAIGDTRNPMIGNAYRAAGLLAALAAAYLHWPLYTIALCGALGEGCGLAAAVVRLQNRQSISAAIMLGPTLLVLSAAGAAAGVLFVGGTHLLVGGVGCVILSVVLLAVLLLQGTALRAEVSHWFRAGLRRNGSVLPS